MEDGEHWVFGLVDVGIVWFGDCGCVWLIDVGVGWYDDCRIVWVFGVGHSGYQHTNWVAFHLCQDFLGSNVEGDDSGGKCFVKRQNLFRFENDDNNKEVSM